MIPKTTETTITGSTKTLDFGSDYRHIYSVQNSGNNDCTLTLNGEREDGAYTIHFFGMTADTDFIFPTDWKGPDGSTNLGTITAADNLWLTCYYKSSVARCSYGVDQ
jgi:hypothetical protein